MLPEVEAMLAAQRKVLLDHDKRIGELHQVILRLLRLFERTDVPTAVIHDALAPVFIRGPVPVASADPEDTRPLVETDVPAIKRDGRPTVEVRTLSDSELMEERS